MSIKVKDIDIKNRTYYLFNDVNIKDFDPNNIKIDEKSYKNILIYYIGYVTIKDLKMNSLNPLYLIFSNVNRYFQEINKYKNIFISSYDANSY